MHGNYVVKPNNGWYQRIDRDTGEFIGQKVRLDKTLTKEFWDPIFAETDFSEYIKNTFSIAATKVVDFNIDEVDDVT
jgi:hypothetical protein